MTSREPEPAPEQGSPDVLPGLEASSRDVVPDLGASSRDVVPDLGADSRDVVPDLGADSRDVVPDLGRAAEVERQVAFNRRLNERMPTKRLIAQGVVRAPDGRVLLCELTYKHDWDLPGGIVDPGESPAHCVVREVREELGLDLPVLALLAVNWLPPYRGWDDALLCLFDLGVLDPELLTEATLLEREIRGVHWVAPADVPARVAPYTATMLAGVLARDPAANTLYLENSLDR